MISATRGGGSDTHPRHGFETIDFVVIGFLVCLLALVSAMSSKLPDPKTPIIAYVSALVGYLAMVRLLNRLNVGARLSLVIRAVSLYLVYFYVYIHFDLVIEFINPFRAEPTLVNIDRFLFGGLNPASVLQGWLNPVAVDVFQLVYASYYPLFLVALIMLYKGEEQRFAAYLTSVALVFALAFIGYMTVPARSPYVVADMPGYAGVVGLTREVVGGPLAMGIRHLLHNADGFKFDCFPSGHTAGAVLVFLTMFSWRRIAGLIVAPLCLALIFSTVYLQYHYVIDLIAGTLLAIFVFLAGKFLVRCLPFGGEKEVPQ